MLAINYCMGESKYWNERLPAILLEMTFEESVNITIENIVK